MLQVFEHILLLEHIANIILEECANAPDQCAFKWCFWSLFDNIDSKLFMLQEYMVLEHDFVPKSHRSEPKAIFKCYQTIYDRGVFSFSYMESGDKTFDKNTSVTSDVE